MGTKKRGTKNAKRGAGGIPSVLKKALLPCGLQKAVATCKIKYFVIIYAALFVAGRVILCRVEPFRLGLLHQIVLTTLSALILHMLRYCYEMGNKIEEVSSGLCGNPKGDKLTRRTMYDYLVSMKTWQRSVWCFLLPIYPAVRFIQINISQEFVPNSITGYYAALFGASTFYLALVAYIHLAISIVFFGMIAHDRNGCIHSDFPKDVFSVPEWLQLWVEYFQCAEKAFFISGTLFTLEYYLLMPKGIISFTPQVIISAKSPKDFIISWLVIVVLIVIAFPIIALVIRSLFHTLLESMRKRTSDEFRRLWNKNQNTTSFPELLAYEQLSLNSIKFGTYIFQAKTYVPAVSTALSLLINLVILCQGFIP